MQNDSGEEEIHVVIETPAPIHSERLMATINQELGGFHRCRVYYVADLPRNAMGKVMRSALRSICAAANRKTRYGSDLG
jgi:acyl-coenzyme A synthetase/AMP-(fatty) acid ligase